MNSIGQKAYAFLYLLSWEKISYGNFFIIKENGRKLSNNKGGEGIFDERPEDQRVMKYEERRKSNSLEMFQ